MPTSGAMASQNPNTRATFSASGRVRRSGPSAIAVRKLSRLSVSPRMRRLPIMRSPGAAAWAEKTAGGAAGDPTAPPGERSLRCRRLLPRPRWLLREAEGKYVCALAGADHAGQEAFGPGAPAGGHGDVLLAVDAVGAGAGVVVAAALELPEQVAGLGVERVELAGGLAAEDEVAGGGQKRGAHRDLVAPAPPFGAGPWVEGADRAGHVLQVDGHAGAPVGDALLELAPPAGGGGPDVLDGGVEQFGVGVVAGVGPFLGAGRAGPEVDGVALLVGEDLGRHVALLVDLAPVDAIPERRHPHRLHVGAIQDVQKAVLVEVGGQLLAVQVEQDVLHRGVVVPQIVRRVLKVRADLARVDVDRHPGIGVQVVALADAAVEVRTGVAGPEVQQVQLGVIGAGHPAVGAAPRPRLALGGQ